MPKVIRVKPTPANRSALAQWGRGQHGVRTVSSHELGFPVAVFAQIPDPLLDGALIDGRPLNPATRRPSKPLRRGRNGDTDAAQALPAAVTGGSDPGGDGAAAGTVAGPTELGTAPGEAEDAPAAVVIPAEATTAEPDRPGEATTSDPTAGPPETTPTVEGRQVPAHQEPQPTEATTAGSVGEVVWQEPEPGEPLPPAPESGHPPDAAPPDTPAPQPAPAAGTDAGRRSRRKTGRLRCPEGCGYVGSEHGVKVHVGKAHGGGESP